MTELPTQDVVLAARAGDRQALDALVSGYLPLVYNVVGRAAENDLDVDDVVQETMLRVLAGLPDVRQVENFRSWVLTIALSRLADARRQARSRRLRQLAGRSADVEPVDPASDFVGLSMLRDSLSREQREVAEAASWLDPGFRDLLALWWLEVSGRLRRADLARSLQESPRHVAVRVQRMRSQLDLSRSVVRALGAPTMCGDLNEVLIGWDGVPGPLWRKRISRHVRGCADCSARSTRLVPPERLLSGGALIAVPGALVDRLAHATTVVRFSQPGAGLGQTGAGKVGASLLLGLGTKTAVAAAAAVILAGGAAGFVTLRPAPTSAEAAVSAPTGAEAAAVPTPSSTTPSVASPAPAVALTPTTAAAPSPTVSSSAKAVAAGDFFTVVPKIPVVLSATQRGAITQNARVGGRDNGQSARYGSRSVWIFDDTTLTNPWGFVSNSGAATTDLNASNGITLTSGNPVTVRPTQTPIQLLPLTAREKAFQVRHGRSTGCTSATDQYCGATFAFWPGPVLADPSRGRVLVFYGKLCRGGGAGTPCSGGLGKGLGTGIAAINMKTGRVTRLTATAGPAVSSVEGIDRTMFFSDGEGFSAAALVVQGVAYVYGDCHYGCELARVPLSQLTDRSKWRFFVGRGKWGAQSTAGVPLIAPGSAGQSVFYDAALKAYVNVYMPFGTDTVKYQVGGSPFGPWSASRTAMETAGGGASNYALFAHPEYAQSGGLVQYLSYFHPADGSQQLVRIEFAKP